MSDNPESSVKKQRIGGNTKSSDAEPLEEPCVQNQLIFIPEIMRQIFQSLDIGTLKQVRLVCKSWLLEAQYHFRKRGIVSLKASDFPVRVAAFISAFNNKETISLPQPFFNLEVDSPIDVCRRDRSPTTLVATNQLLGICPPLVISKLSSAQLPMSLFVPLLTQCSSTLESLRITKYLLQETEMPTLDPNVTFPKLKSLDVHFWQCVSPNIQGFPAILISVVKSCPNLEKFQFKGRQTDPNGILHERTATEISIISSILMQANFNNVKSLAIKAIMNEEASKHFLARSFSRLESLQLLLYVMGSDPVPILLQTIRKVAGTLQELNLTDYRQQSFIDVAFPLCPNVKELHLGGFPYWNNFLFSNFPSLQELNITTIFSKDEHSQHAAEDNWCSISPMPGVKTLRVGNFMDLSTDEDEAYEDDDDDEEEEESREDPCSIKKLFEKFPSVERLLLNYSYLQWCCHLKATGKPMYAELLENVKHLELCGSDASPAYDEDYSFLSVLKGVETIKMAVADKIVTTIPVKELPALKVLQFPWVDGLKLTRMIEMVSGMEKVLVDNCCSFPRTTWFLQNIPELKRFFDSAPNALCGCKEARPRIPKSSLF